MDDLGQPFRRAGTAPARAPGAHSGGIDPPGFAAVLAAVLAVARPGPDDRIVDVGAGAASPALSLAPAARSVLAIDSAPLGDLAAEAAERGLDNLYVQTVDLSLLRMPYSSADIVVASDALHRVANHDKRALLVRARRWLRPGGRIVVVDPAYWWAGPPQDTAAPGTTGPASGRRRAGRDMIWRGLGVGSRRPVPPEFWRRALADAGFRDIGCRRVTADTGLLAWGTSPTDPPGSATGV